MPAVTTTDTREAESLCAELGIEVLHASKRIRTGPCSPQQTHSAVRIQKMINLKGREHAWAVLYALSEMENPPIELKSSLIGAVSDLFCNYPAWEQRLGDFLNALDLLDLEELQRLAWSGPGIDGASPKTRILITGYLQVLLMPVMEPQDQGVFL